MSSVKSVLELTTLPSSRCAADRSGDVSPCVGVTVSLTVRRPTPRIDGDTGRPRARTHAFRSPGTTLREQTVRR
jgi:hypothetical protein